MYYLHFISTPTDTPPTQHAFILWWWNDAPSTFDLGGKVTCAEEFWHREVLGESIIYLHFFSYTRVQSPLVSAVFVGRSTWTPSIALIYVSAFDLDSKFCNCHLSFFHLYFRWGILTSRSFRRMYYLHYFSYPTGTRSLASEFFVRVGWNNESSAFNLSVLFIHRGTVAACPLRLLRVACLRILMGPTRWAKASGFR